eukprot:m.380723 g.380723  ORF g.380723 m.380723 type:complete len:177 (+) comp56235_c0_seq16:154-684(+)
MLARHFELDDDFLGLSAIGYSRTFKQRVAALAACVSISTKLQENRNDFRRAKKGCNQQGRHSVSVISRLTGDSAIRTVAEIIIEENQQTINFMEHALQKQQDLRRSNVVSCASRVSECNPSVQRATQIDKTLRQNLPNSNTVTFAEKSSGWEEDGMMSHCGAQSFSKNYLHIHTDS